MRESWLEPKVSPTEVAQVALQAVIDGTEDVYPGQLATEVAAKLLQDPKGVERWMAQFLPAETMAGMQV